MLHHKEPSLAGRIYHYLALDIETTGQSLEKDCCFAVGYCVGTGPGPHEVRERGQFVLDLKKPSNKSWEKFWEMQGWEMRCYNEFWKEHEDILNDMQRDDVNCTDEGKVFQKLNDLIDRIERDPHVRKLIVVTDTTMFDTVWLCQRLQKYGYADLMHMRDGTGYREGMELDSLRHGVTKRMPKDDGSYYTNMRLECNNWEKHAIQAMGPLRPHRAEDDAVDIYTRFLSTLNATCM